MTTTLQLRGPNNESATVTSERAARATARAWLGVARVSEYPTATGWMYQATNADEDAPAVRVRVV